MCRAGSYLSLVVIGVVLVAACSEPGPPVSAGPQPELVWPAPPLTPRIRFVRTISRPEDVGIKAGWLESVFSFIKGAPERFISSPYGIRKDANDRIYVVDTLHKAVLVLDPAASGHYWFPEDPLEGFENPIDIALGSDDRVYVSDSQANVVHVFGKRGKKYLGHFGSDVLQRPTGLALEKTTGNLLVVDTLASQIVVFDTATLKAKKFVGREGTARDAFHYPTNVAIAPDGRIYVTDSLNFRVQVLGPDFTFLSAFGQVGDSPGDFARPKGVAVDSEGHVYVVDALFDNVQIFDRQGRLLLAFGSPGAAPGQFWLPNEILIDAEDRIYVSDAYNQRIQVFQYLREAGGEQ